MRALSLWLASILVSLPAFGQEAVRIQIHSDAAASGTAGTAVVQPVQLAAMPLGGGLQAASLPPAAGLQILQAPQVRIRGVVAAPAALAATATARPRSRPTAALPQAPAGEDAAKTAEAIRLPGSAAKSANGLARAVAAPAAKAAGGAGGLQLREEIGGAFDGSDRLRPQELDVLAGPITAEELFGAGQAGIEAPKDADRLARLADDTARLRGLRATQGEKALSAEDAAVLRGIDDLARAVALGKSTPAELAAAARVVERIDLEKLRRFSALADAFIKTDVPGRSSPFARVGNVEHVEQQLLEPLLEDGPALAQAFKTDPKESTEHFVEMLRALQYATDTGKQEVPPNMKAALARFNSQQDTGPNWYVNNFILPHEYASMVLVQTLGAQAKMTPREILAFQKLIANHNFGPDLTRPENAGMREHWWPKNFRQNTLPMLRAMGIDVNANFSADETGTLQYNHAQGHALTLLLSAYDRAIAVGAHGQVHGNGNGLATWKKYAIQDFNGKKGQLAAVRGRNAKRGEGELLEPDPPGAPDEDGKAGAIFEFDGPSVINTMFSAADWAQLHVESLWASLYDALPEGGPARARYTKETSWRNYPPFRAQRKSIGALLGLLRLTRDANPTGMTNRADVLPGAGIAYYEGQGRLHDVYRVQLERVGTGAFDSRSQNYEYRSRIEVLAEDPKAGPGRYTWTAPRGPPFIGEGKLATEGQDPVALMMDLIRYDKGW